MARRRKGRDIHGWIALDKPVGMTSTQAVGLIKRLFQAKKAGHAGTLDPLASGCLPIALGEATKTVSHIMDGRKAYRFTVRWGIGTESDDTEGAVTDTSDARPDEDAILALLPRFTGLIDQVPPIFSAIKVDGERAYDIARDGDTVELDARPVRIDSLDLIGCPDADTAIFEAFCGKGTYVRALARDMGRALGCFGHVIALRRLSVGPIDEEMLVTADELKALAEEGDEALAEVLHPVALALEDLTEIALRPADAQRILNGQQVLLRDAPLMASGAPVYATSGGELVALGEIEQGRFVPKRVFAF